MCLHCTQDCDSYTTGQLQCLEMCVQAALRGGVVRAAEISRRDGRNCLHWGARNGRSECARWLLSTSGLGLSVDCLTADGVCSAVLWSESMLQGLRH
jgi:hypothetical protein